MPAGSDPNPMAARRIRGHTPCMTRNAHRVLLLAVLLLLPACRGGRSSCVSLYSAISTPGGETRASEIETGDLVTTLRPDGSLGIGRVTGVRLGTSSTLLTITLSDGRVLRVTPDHPVGLAGSEFLAAGRLREGASVRTGDADATVVSIERNRGDYRVVDFTVEPDANFYANGVLVHNKLQITPPPKPTMPGRYVSVGTGTMIELTETGGRLVLPKPAGNSRLPDGDSVWEIGPWTLDEYTMTAPLTRRHDRDWLSLAIEEDQALLVIRAVDTTGPIPARPDRPEAMTIIQSARIETPSERYGLGSGWTTPGALQGMLQRIEAEFP